VVQHFDRLGLLQNIDLYVSIIGLEIGGKITLKQKRILYVKTLGFCGDAGL